MRSNMPSLVLALIVALATFAAVPAKAQEQYAFGLPTAVSSPRGEWNFMRDGSHEPTSDSARQQCIRNIDSGLIAATYALCDRLKAKRDSGDYVDVWVPESTAEAPMVFNVMNGFNPQRGSYTTLLVEQKLGRAVEAELYDMGTDIYGNRLYAYFFTGEDGCNNIAWVIIPPSPPAPPEPDQEETVVDVRETRVVCRLVRVGRGYGSPTYQFTPGFLLPSCCPECVGPTLVPGQFRQLNAGGLRSSSWRRVCEEVYIREGDTQ